MRSVVCWAVLLASLSFGVQTAVADPTASQPPDLHGEPLAQPEPDAPSSLTKQLVNEAKRFDTGVKDGVSAAVLRAEVMLDRLHASPGVIDGQAGENFINALKTFERHKDLKVTNGLDEKVWAALIKDSPRPVLIDYVTTEADVAGPFFPDLPKDYGELAKLPTIGYRSATQKLAAKFHLAEQLLADLNPGVDLTKTGVKLLVPDVEPEKVQGVVNHVVVDKSRGQVLAFDRRGHVVAAYPATIGSRALPSPSGTYRIRGIAHNPIYYYDPKNFVQGDNKEKLKLPPGPNNPVGSVFIALSKPTYGLHGTPDPSRINKTASHGCVRMTNWNARELASLVRPGMVVSFRR